MARNTGPKTKISRRYNVLIGGSAKAFERKNYPPGMHGPKGSRRKVSDYAIALAEKQKLRHQYGVLEKQFRRYFAIAVARRGVTGETLLQLLETRVDNVVYRLGFATSRAQARQMVSHGHFAVNGVPTDIPSYEVRPGDRVEVRESHRSRELFKTAKENLRSHQAPEWLSLDASNLSGTILAIPRRDQMPLDLSEQLVVEYYSR